MRLAALALLVAWLGACSGARRAQADATTFIVVRHAEKADASRDPVLAPAGAVRARALADLLAGEPLVAVYATELQRTAQTAAPSASRHKLEVTRYQAALPASALAPQLRAAHPRGSVLIVGHSNTVPAIVAALCGCDATPMRDDEYDRLSRVRIDASGRASLLVTRYATGAPVR